MNSCKKSFVRERVWGIIKKEQGKEAAMNSVETVNDVLVNLFNEIMDIEERV